MFHWEDLHGQNEALDFLGISDIILLLSLHIDERLNVKIMQMPFDSNISKIMK